MHSRFSKVRSAESVQWCYQDPRTEQMISLPDIENEIVENAYENQETKVELDDYSVDLLENTLTSKHNEFEKPVPIKRETNIPVNQHIRPERFCLDETVPTLQKFPIFSDIDLATICMRAWMKNNKLNWDDVRKDEKAVNEVVVKKASYGIRMEGKLLKKEIAANYIATYLDQVAGESIEKIGRRCAHLYTKESFLYYRVNAMLRNGLIQIDDIHSPLVTALYTNGKDPFPSVNNIQGTEPCETQNLMPFCVLLDAFLRNSWSVEVERLYRGVRLCPEMIQQYKDEIGKQQYWSCFTSTTTNREVAKMYGCNTVFELDVDLDDDSVLVVMAGIKQYSQFPDEEEVLLAPGTNFEIKAVEEQPDGTHVIQLTLGTCV